MERYGKLEDDYSSSFTPPPPQEQTPQGIYLQMQKPTTYDIPQKVFKVLGSIQVVIGLVSIALGIAGIIVHREHVSIVGYGIWCGILFSLTGSFTIVAGVKRTLCWVIACMVMSIVAATFTLITLGFGGAELGIGMSEIDVYDDYGNDYSYYHYRRINAEFAAATGVFMVIGSITEAILAIICSAITCTKTCCSPATYQLVQTNPSVQYQPGQQVIVISSPQQVPPNV